MVMWMWMMLLVMVFVGGGGGGGGGGAERLPSRGSLHDDDEDGTAAGAARARRTRRLPDRRASGRPSAPTSPSLPRARLLAGTHGAHKGARRGAHGAALRHAQLSLPPTPPFVRGAPRQSEAAALRRPAAAAAAVSLAPGSRNTRCAPRPRGRLTPARALYGRGVRPARRHPRRASDRRRADGAARGRGRAGAASGGRCSERTDCCERGRGRGGGGGQRAHHR
eukprot:scaffold886_cov317-Prasinococcus_capsulatus_cf.AAC.5